MASILLCSLVYLARVCQGAYSGPTVTLDFGTFLGISHQGSGTDTFYGLPFAAPPVGGNRLRPPQPFPLHYGTVVQNATVPKLDCAQPSVEVSVYIPPGYVGPNLTDAGDLPAAGSEDCLYLDVVRPTSATSASRLPVMFWIYGGSFIGGGISSYNGTSLVAHSIAMSKDIIYVAANYRLSGWGWLPGREMQEAGLSNIGLLDQRAALVWVQNYIGAFGGDPDKVTIFGESAGSISIGFQLLLYGGVAEGSFRAAITESGSPLPVATMENGQGVFDEVASLTGCSSAVDKIACLRTVDEETFSNAIARPIDYEYSYRALAFQYMPRVDGKTLPDYPQNLLRNGRFEHVPIISGDNGDEGTLFTVDAFNITTNSGVEGYFAGLFNDLSNSTLQLLLDQYSADPAEGSPYGTGDLYAVTPESKRVTSILGDVFFNAPRRYLSNIYVRSGVPIWSYLFTTTQGTPFYGAAHATEVPFVYGEEPGLIGQQMPTLWISFANDLDPNQYGAYGAALDIPYWPQYGDNATQLNFQLNSSSTIQDDYRISGTNVVLKHIDQFILV